MALDFPFPSLLFEAKSSVLTMTTAQQRWDGKEIAGRLHSAAAVASVFSGVEYPLGTKDLPV